MMSNECMTALYISQYIHVCCHLNIFRLVVKRVKGGVFCYLQCGPLKVLSKSWYGRSKCYDNHCPMRWIFILRALFSAKISYRTCFVVMGNWQDIFKQQVFNWPTCIIFTNFRHEPIITTIGFTPHCFQKSLCLQWHTHAKIFVGAL